MLRDAPLTDPSLWLLEPGLGFLNHGSFGACPREVLDVQAELRARLERQPVTFLVREIEGRLDAAREVLAEFVGAAPGGLVFVPNATTGVNTVLASLELAAGDELVVTDQEYNACRNALDVAAERAGARVVVVRLPFPCSGPEEVVDAVMAGVTERTRLVLIDHVVSQTAMVLPIAEIVERLNEKGVESLIDGAHAPGMVDVDLRALGAPYYTGNCHKWMCAPKVAGFLWVGEHRREAIRPLVISHGANAPLGGRSRLHAEFDWTGTFDPTASLCVPEAIRVMGGLLPGGWDELRAANRALAIEAQGVLCAALGIDAPCPEAMVGSMATVPLPDSAADACPPSVPMYIDPLQDRLLEEYRVEVPVFPWPGFPQRVLRVSCQAYNTSAEYVRLGRGLRDVF